MATNRKVQRLLNEFMDLLTEYEVDDANIDKMDVTPPPTQAKATAKVGKMDVTPPSTQANDTAKVDKMDVTPPATEADDTVAAEQTPS